MKTKEQIKKEEGCSDVFTLDEFGDAVDCGGINSNDGIGYFHDGNNETRITVWNDKLTWDDVKGYPYICWYNK